jgi:hypothetical protein
VTLRRPTKRKTCALALACLQRMTADIDVRIAHRRRSCRMQSWRGEPPARESAPLAKPSPGGALAAVRTAS